ncbi:MAG: hypothetical protein IJF03_02375 [Lachnospiraceae bacterium]|nr:hypothetical protein [Lachnospiraceae bacterium]
MSLLSLLMHKGICKFVYGLMASGIIGGAPSWFLFGELPFPKEEYISIKEKMK